MVQIQNSAHELADRIGPTLDNPDLSAQHKAAIELLDKMRGHFDGTRAIRDFDRMCSKISRIENSIGEYYDTHPDVAKPTADHTVAPDNAQLNQVNKILSGIDTSAKITQLRSGSSSTELLSGCFVKQEVAEAASSMLAGLGPGYDPKKGDNVARMQNIIKRLYTAEPLQRWVVEAVKTIKDSQTDPSALIATLQEVIRQNQEVGVNANWRKGN